MPDNKTTDGFVPPAAKSLPKAALDSAAAGASMLDAVATTDYGRSLLAHALVQLQRDGWLRDGAEDCPKAPIEKVREVRNVSASQGTWNDSPYMHGLYHGLELALSILEGEREPEYRDLPEDGYLCRRPQPDLSGPEFAPVAHTIAGQEFG